VASALLLVVGIAVWSKQPIIALLVAPVVLVAPGRIVRAGWRDLLLGLKYLNDGDFARSKQHSQNFVVQVRRSPWLKQLIWLASSAYSRDPEAMALNNLGAAQIGMMDYAEGREALLEAIALDDKNPLPYYNLSLLATRTGQAAEAAVWLGQAKALGYTGGASDRYFRARQVEMASRASVEAGIEPSPTPRSFGRKGVEAIEPRYSVELMNDDTTPMEFVIYVLRQVFGKTHAESMGIMLDTHNHGRGVCDIFEEGEAKQKLCQVQELARERGYPLQCVIKPVKTN